MMKTVFAIIFTASLIVGFGITNVSADATVDGNLNIHIPCVEVGNSYYQCDLLKYSNSVDPSGYYWKLGSGVIQTVDDGDCGSVDNNLSITLPTLDLYGKKFRVLLSSYPNAEDTSGLYWTLQSFSPKPNEDFSLYSQDFSDGGIIPLVNACTNEGGLDVSPQLTWENPPQGTTSYALIMDDEDSPCGKGDNACRHWSVFNVPGSVTNFQKNQNIALLSGVTEGENWEGKIGYSGPCPPNRHTYNFTVFALASDVPTIDSGVKMTRSQFESTYAPYILDSANLQGVFVP